MPIDAGVRMIACGHTHVPMDRTIKGVRVVNAGSVGLPFDGDPRACYAIISDPAARGGVGAEQYPTSTQVELRRVVYDVETVVEQFYAVNHPAADISAYNRWTGRSFGSSLIYTPEMRRHKSNEPGNRNKGLGETAQQNGFQAQAQISRLLA